MCSFVSNIRAPYYFNVPVSLAKVYMSSTSVFLKFELTVSRYVPSITIPYLFILPVYVMSQCLIVYYLRSY